MSGKILINVIKANVETCFNAADKARSDVEKTLVRNGYEVVNIPLIRDINQGKAIWKHLLEIKRALILIKKEQPNNIIVQYPGFRIGLRSISFIMKFLYKYNVTFIVHDVDSIRFRGVVSKREIRLMNKASKIILHTEKMREYLEEQGVKTPMKVMWLFDYYGNGQPINKNIESPYSIIFAGNLQKSGFLKKIGRLLDSHHLYLYGLPVNHSWEGNISYEGKFAPDDIEDLKGDWGLVWDGESTKECDGNMGKYLQYNSSHKNSLYIASGKPVIVWRKAAVAPFILKNNLGIAIDSLDELPKALDSISQPEYIKMLESVKKYQELLQAGKMLEHLL